MSLTTARGLKPLTTAALAVVVAVTVGACDGSAVSPAPGLGASPTTSQASTSVSPKPTATDYSRLLLQPKDVSIPPDEFTVRSSKTNPNGVTGASVLFVNADDTRALADTILIYPDAETASATLHQAASAVGNIVTGGSPQPFPVGSDGTAISGTSPDGSKAVTLLLFTSGPALVRMEFNSATDEPTSPQVVAGVGKMQDIALRLGLPTQE